MKSIDTLVPDIQDLFQYGHAVTEEVSEAYGLAIAEHLRRRLSEATEPRKPSLRMSNLGTKCDRKLWYELNKSDKAEALGPEVRMKFHFGDVLETMLLYLAEMAGHTVERRQEEVEINGVLGHIDAVVDGVLIDVKSASSYSFAKFEAGLSPDVDDFGYLTQLDLYLNGLNIDVGAFLVIDKTLGKICLDKHPRKVLDYTKVIDDKRELLARSSPPSRAYRAEPDGKSGNMKLGVACSYCAYKKTCWPGVRTFLYASGPRFLTEVRRTPDVQEAKDE